VKPQPDPTPQLLAQRVRFLGRVAPFRGLDATQLATAAEALTEEEVPAGTVLLVESGPPGTDLFVVRRGSVELSHKDVVVGMVGRGEVFGYPTLLTRLPPQFTARARDASALYRLPAAAAVGLLLRPEGLSWLARSQRERLLAASRTMRGFVDVRSRPVTSLLRSKPLFCTPQTSIREAGDMMRKAGVSALLVRLREGMGIVTDVDFRDKVTVEGVSPDQPVSTIMTTPVHTISADMLAPEASIAMMASGVNHVPVVDADYQVVGVLSARHLMALDSRSPFALRRSMQRAGTDDDLVQTSGDLTELLLDLIDANVDAPTLTRILTLLSDTITSRLIELAIARHGAPPLPFAWLAFGSTARNELTLASDQDNGIAYADGEDGAAAEAYFADLARDVNTGLARCGFALDPHGVLASSPSWRMPLSRWRAVFEDCLEGGDVERLARASVAFDFRQVAGELQVDLALTQIMRDAPGHKSFMRGLAQLAARTPTPLGFWQRLDERIDIKTGGLVPIQNLARYHAFAKGISAHSTLERLLALHELDPAAIPPGASLREAYVCILGLQLRHHAAALRRGERPDNTITTTDMSSLTRSTLLEALREVSAAQRRFPRLAAALR